MYKPRSRSNSGQVLIITSLIVVLLSLSTVMYINEMQKTAPVFVLNSDASLSALKQTSAQTLTSALVNITNGGTMVVLAEDLERLEAAVETQSCNSINSLQYVPLDSAPYIDGVWVSWAADGIGISSACIDFAANSSSASASSYLAYRANVTSNILVSGEYAMMNETHRDVNVSLSVFNEDKPALSKKQVVYYNYNGLGMWIQAYPETNDYGNGTYLLSFIVATERPEMPLTVSVHVEDLRGIAVWGNVTCMLS